MSRVRGFRRNGLVGAVLALCLLTGTIAHAEDAPLVEQYLHSGKLAEGEAALQAVLKKSPQDDQARFGLGVLQFIRAVEHLGQSFHRYGLFNERTAIGSNIPFLRLPVPANPKPEQLTYEAAGQIFVDLLADLEKSEATLAAVRDEKVKLPLQLAGVRLDYDGDGQPEDSFGVLIGRYMGAQAEEGVGKFPVTLDRGDVAWLRGYSHILMGLTEFILAHDGRELFDRTAHLFFANPKTPFPFLKTPPGGGGEGQLFNNPFLIVDAITLVHLVQLPVADPERMKSSLAHFEQVFALSRESWKFILAETDNDHEWIPSPKQDSVIGVPVTQEMVDGWFAFLDEAEAIFAGKRLLPFWRNPRAGGINLRRVFTEPQTFDLVLWIQGTAAMPYVEQGPLTSEETWNRLSRVFGGNFIGFAIWFN